MQETVQNVSCCRAVRIGRKDRNHPLSERWHYTGMGVQNVKNVTGDW